MVFTVREINFIGVFSAVVVFSLLYLQHVSPPATTTPTTAATTSGRTIEGTDITLEFIKNMIDDFKAGNRIHHSAVHQILEQTRDVLRKSPTLVDIAVPDGKNITVCGDTHGQFHDLLRIFELNGLPSEDNPYLFNGDFVDRGDMSLEVALTLFAFKCMNPNAIYLARGNHETRSMNRYYGFENEVKAKLNNDFAEHFAQVFDTLPLAHVLNSKVFVVHGGLFSVDGVTLDDIRAIDRFREPGHYSDLMTDMLWSDPNSGLGRGPSKRSLSPTFGSDVTQKFLTDNNLDLLVRSHEMKQEGFEIQHDGRLITVFSAPNYAGHYTNKGAFIRFEAPELKPGIVTFSGHDST